MEIIVPKDKLKDIFENIKERFTVFAPQKDGDKKLLSQVKAFKEVDLSILKTQSSLKELLFPRFEILFDYKWNKKEITIKEDNVVKPQVVLGIRACDIRGLKVLDNLFSWENIKDNLYLERRQKTVLITQSCLKPDSFCFCQSFSISPVGGEGGEDINFTELSDCYLFRSFSYAGEKLLKELIEEFSFSLPADKDKKAFEELKEKTTTSKIANIEELAIKIKRNFYHNLWKDISWSCLNCGICTYTCPTCHCFDIVDESNDREGRRIRCWDSCMFSHFTAMASGCNPRETKESRFRQRLAHKFSYFPENLGIVACTGCGRCIELCPAGINLQKILTKLGRECS